MGGPYRIFFPLGILAGLMGTLAWVPFSLQLTSNYPGTEHPHLMIGGFLYAFVVGFLMTAIPRFTDTAAAKGWEIFLQLFFMTGIIGVGTVSLFLPGWREWSLLFQVLSVFSLMVFGASRFFSRKQSPPPSFLFVGVGMLCAVLGSILLYADEKGIKDFGAMGKTIFYHGMILSLVVGIGGRLIPVFLGLAPNPMDKEAVVKAPPKGLFVGLAILYFGSFPVEFFLSEMLGRTLRAALVSFVAVAIWKLLKAGKRKGAMTFWIRVSGWLIVIGLWVYALIPEGAVHGAHLIFAGGFTLLTFLVSMRVVLSHGGYDLNFELTSPRVHAIGMCVVVAALARVVAPLTPQSYVHHLGYASFLWAVGALIWAVTFIPRIIRGTPGA